MADPIAVDVAYTSAAIERMLSDYPELAEDAALRLDTVDGATDLEPLMSRLVRMRQERLAMAEGINTYVADLTARRDRFARGADGLKGLMLQLMRSAQLPKMVLPEATVSVTKARETVSITDIDALPQGAFKTIRQPDKTAIKAMIDAGDDVPGAAIVMGETSISVRVK